jgi:hypothetical protein
MDGFHPGTELSAWTGRARGSLNFLKIRGGNKGTIPPQLPRRHISLAHLGGPHSGGP